ncbi:MAG: hypothetical protein JKY50_00335 [Oleispira sp.]|nr:hypothetical protein [Oleispira sp.]
MKTLDSFMDECDKEDRVWLKKHRSDWMTDDQFLSWLFMSQLFDGFHHVNGKVIEYGSGIKVNISNSKMATFDYDYLTKAVVMAHNWGIRFEIEPASSRQLRFILHKRHTREGSMSKRHPSMNEAIEKFNHI